MDSSSFPQFQSGPRLCLWSSSLFYLYSLPIVFSWRFVSLKISMYQSPGSISTQDFTSDFQIVYLTSPFGCWIYISNITGPKQNSCSFSLNPIPYSLSHLSCGDFNSLLLQGNILRFPLDSLPSPITHPILSGIPVSSAFKIYPGSDNFSPSPLLPP